MNTPMMEAARQMPHMMGSMMAHPMTGGAMMAAGGYAAGKGLLGAGAGLLRNPLLFLAAGVAAGYLAFKYEKEIVAAVSRATGMGKDFMLHQKENLDDLIAETKEGQPAAAPAQE
ncbi:MAG: hypothetical protein AB1642_03655 [Pseudomonadota bacterium]